MRKQVIKTTITLEQLEELLAIKRSEETGKIVRPEFPLEKQPAWFSFCKRNWTAWQQQKERRMQEMTYLEIIETHQLDYYLTQDPIVPF